MVAGPSHTHRLGLVDAYRDAAQQGLLENYWQGRWQKAAGYALWLSATALPSLSLEQSLVLYRASGGSRSKQFQENPIDEIRDSLDFLLYDTIKLEGRFDECVSPEGAYKLAGAGREFVSFLLCLRDPSLFGCWNTNAERGLRRLGRYPKSLGKGHWGLRYLDLLETLQRVRQEYGLADFRDVDRFNYWLVRLSGSTTS